MGQRLFLKLGLELRISRFKLGRVVAEGAYTGFQLPDPTRPRSAGRISRWRGLRCDRRFCRKLGIEPGHPPSLGLEACPLQLFGFKLGAPGFAFSARLRDLIGTLSLSAACATLRSARRRAAAPRSKNQVTAAPIASFRRKD